MFVAEEIAARRAVRDDVQAQVVVVHRDAGQDAAHGAEPLVVEHQHLVTAHRDVGEPAQAAQDGRPGAGQQQRVERLLIAGLEVDAR